MLNKVILSGYLGKFTKVGMTSKNQKYASFQLSQYTGDPNNKYQYVPIVAFDGEKVKPATRIEQAKDGDYITVECHIKSEKKRDGDKTVTELSLIADSIRDVITPMPRENTSQQAYNKPTQAPPQSALDSSPFPSYGLDISSDDLPF